VYHSKEAAGRRLQAAGKAAASRRCSCKPVACSIVQCKMSLKRRGLGHSVGDGNPNAGRRGGGTGADPGVPADPPAARTSRLSAGNLGLNSTGALQGFRHFSGKPTIRTLRRFPTETGGQGCRTLPVETLRRSVGKVPGRAWEASACSLTLHVERECNRGRCRLFVHPRTGCESLWRATGRI